MSNPNNIPVEEHRAFTAAHEIGEPTTSADGRPIRLFESPYGGIELHVIDREEMFYGNDELEILGDGDRARGIQNVGRAAYIGAKNDDMESFDYEPRYLDGKLYKARYEGLL
jgi:hypothetical protein